MPGDPFNLERFVAAQAPVYADVRAELGSGQKRSHWMWFVFPQIGGLGRSPTAQRYAISGRDEALAYLRHAILGPRLIECTEWVLAIRGQSLEDIFPAPDDMKFCSSMTLFAAVAPEQEVFMKAIRKYCAGRLDAETVRLLA